MKFEPELQPARLIRRYKRFLSDIEMPDGEIVVAHCANPGAMLGLDQPGDTVWIQPSTNPKRKLAWSWLLVEPASGGLVGIDTSLPNRLVAEALAKGAIPQLAGYRDIRPEQRYGEASRIDFLLTDSAKPTAYVEVKNAHLCRQSGLAEFPDCETKRGKKHLEELSRMVGDGHRAVMLYVVQRNDCTRFAIAGDLDPAYAKSFEAAHKAGVEMIALGTEITPRGIEIAGEMPIVDRSGEGR